MNLTYRKDIELLYHAFMYSPVSLLSGIYPVPAMHSLLVTSDVRNIKFTHSFSFVLFNVKNIICVTDGVVKDNDH